MFLEYILKITRTIDGCDTIEKLDVAYKMIENFINTRRPKDSRINEDLKKYYCKKYKEIEKLCVQ